MRRDGGPKIGTRSRRAFICLRSKDSQSDSEDTTSTRYSEKRNCVHREAHRGICLIYNSTGKVILAYLPGERVEEILDICRLRSVTKNTITDRDQLFKGLERNRERGYSYNKGKISKEFGQSVCRYSSHMTNSSAP